MTSTSTHASPLYRIDECADLMADACVTDEHGYLIFLSIWGRDTAIQEFIARLTLGQQAEGLDQFHLLNEHHQSIPVFVGNVERLGKRTTRTFLHTLFGGMVHLWLYDKRCVAPDRTNATAFAVLRKECPSRDEQLWMLVQQTCPLPLLDHWRDTVLALLQSHNMLTPLPFAYGPLEGHQLVIDVPILTRALGERILDGRLDAD